MFTGSRSTMGTVSAPNKWLSFTAAVGAPKTASGEAWRVEQGSVAGGSLLAHRLKQDAEKLRIAPAYRDQGPVFAPPNGEL